MSLNQATNDGGRKRRYGSIRLLTMTARIHTMQEQAEGVDESMSSELSDGIVHSCQLWTGTSI